MLIISNTITNTLATITNGTNIYLQQQITTTHISNITETLTNTINNIPQLDKVWYQDPTMWAAIATVVSAIIMACTFLKIKQQEKDTQYREDKKELRDFIEKHLISEVEKRREKSEKANHKVLEEDLNIFNYYIDSSLIRLINYSLGLFYEDRLEIIYNKIKVYSSIIYSHEKYSYDVKSLFSGLLQYISLHIYKALIDEQAFNSLMTEIDSDINRLKKNLKPHNSQ